ncbi:carbamate kinase [Mycoplasma sp. SG1]|uniref:carbamate kinase n=1 Tax=Mycoplasma sp. SG1 TaxID=2810348 RepID=UPI0020259276|nr:carbamate kinase [Mycoplasma sp. SG1]URM52741.1 carbamate kinase [Mycoplasma sp. SG1]
MSKIVVAIGGNALGNTPKEQKEIVKNTAKHLVKFIKQGNDLVIVHGNGLQVGMINNGFFLAHKHESTSPVVDFPECGAMSQGYIGYHLQQAIKNELKKEKINKDVVTLITQIVVDKNDDAFKNPTKPIGRFMSEEDAELIAKKNHWVVKKDSDRGWRRVIASPQPIDIIEKEIINKLIDNKAIVITAGGGGIPVIYDKNNGYAGIPAVIDKDFSAFVVAKMVNAERLVILTAVDEVMLNYGTENQKGLKTVKSSQIKELIKTKQFASGSMLPKVLAALSFVEASHKSAVIGNLNKTEEVLTGKSGTKIIL